MSFYNMLHGYEETASVVIGLLNVDPKIIPRFRDAYITYRDATRQEAVMVILTRTGGGNRADHVTGNTMLQGLTGYLDDMDDEFDATFALFRYRILSEAIQTVALNYLIEHGAPLSLREKTMQAIGPDQTRRQKHAAEQVVGMIKDAVTRMDK